MQQSMWLKYDNFYEYEIVETILKYRRLAVVDKQLI